MSAAAAADLWS